MLTGATRDADLLAVVVDSVPDAGRLALVVHDLHVGDVDRGFLGDDATGLRAALGRADAFVLLDAVHALDEDLVLPRVGHDDLALGTLVPAGDDDDRVALLDLHAISPRRSRSVVAGQTLS